MIGERLTQLRLARNLTLEALSAKIGGVVTKQALSKYEQNQSQPSPTVLTRLSAALGVKANYFLAPPQITVKFLAYRKASSLLEREKNRVKSIVTECLEDSIRVQALIGQSKEDIVPWNKLAISSLEDTEQQAIHLRALWDLGSSPINDVVETLEEHRLCVLTIEADEKFDGISALGYDASGEILAGAIVSRQDIPGERQRLNLSHELGHLVLKVPDTIDEEQAAFRFASAFLVPAEKLIEAIGTKRSYVHISELFGLKKRFGISVQAILRRMLELGIINETYYRRWCIYLSKAGWKKHEPHELESEEPKWLSRNLSRLVAEGAISKEEAERMLGVGINVDEFANIDRRGAFLKLSLDKRRQLLAGQVELLSEYYETEAEELVAEDAVNDY
jgi:Zn-dependent peptidase ImmA (M78 family)/DNA-binding XRE family transcriptional regulator